MHTIQILINSVTNDLEMEKNTKFPNKPYIMVKMPYTEG